MRRTLSLLVLAVSASLFPSGAVHGQTLLAVRGGVAVGEAWRVAEEPSSVTRRVGVYAEAGVIRPQTRGFDFDVGIAYVQEGLTRVAAGQTQKLTVDYLGVPVMLRLRVPGRVSPHAAVGLSGSLRLGCRSIRSGGLTQIYYGADPAVIDCDRESVRTLEFGAIGGLGLDVQVGGGTLLIADVRVRLGLSSAGAYDRLKTTSVVIGAAWPLG